MPILDKKNQVEVQRYIDFTKNYPNAHYYQDYRWSNVKNNLECECVYVEENGMLKAIDTLTYTEEEIRRIAIRGFDIAMKRNKILS